MEKYVCIHGHFYQPPRENAWLEAVEFQDSAFPWHDWNARITAECYGPNTASRILGRDGRIAGIMNNYSQISFNVGPTLFSWMEQADPEVYAAIVAADSLSRDIHSGHGSAIAQVYNHIIMPLANRRDKITQIRWGIHDFRHRFGRDPEGMWLAETAVDTETLELMAEHGILFTILAPRQAAKVRRIGEEEWHDVSGGRVDPRRAYRCNLPSGRTIALFFYDGPVSQDLAFAGLLNNGDAYADRLLAVFEEDGDPVQLAHVATDGESYGHHHKQGEMALSYCLHRIATEGQARVTVYGEFLEMHPPEWEARIHENSSWSCVHGIGRWKENCGCNSGGNAGWSQLWRGPLREALDWLREELIPLFERHGGRLFRDPWAARDAWIRVILDRSEDNVNGFLSEHCIHEPGEEEVVRALSLLEMQRHALLMYTSCGWFFDELSGLETTQVMQYAARAIQLARDVLGTSLEEGFLSRLSHARSNLTDLGPGDEVYRRLVMPAMVSLPRVGAHYAIMSLFQDYRDSDRLYSFTVERDAGTRLEAGKARMAVGRIRLRSILTRERQDLSFAVLHLGDQNVSGGVREYMGEEAYGRMGSELREAFLSGNVPETVRCIDRHFEHHNYSLWHLFRDQQRQIIARIFDETETSIENFYRQVYRDHYHLLHVLDATGNSLPRILRTTAQFILNRDLRELMERLPIEEERFRATVDEIHKWDVPIERELLGFIGSAQIRILAEKLAVEPFSAPIVADIETLFARYAELNVPLNLWYSQNIVYQIGMQQFFLRRRMADKGEMNAAAWVERFRRVSTLMGVTID